MISIDTGAIDYALTPVWVEHKATHNQYIEADKRLIFKGIEIPFLPPLGSAGSKTGSTSRDETGVRASKVGVTGSRWNEPVSTESVCFFRSATFGRFLMT